MAKKKTKKDKTHPKKGKGDEMSSAEKGAAKAKKKAAKAAKRKISKKAVKKAAAKKKAAVTTKRKAAKPQRQEPSDREISAKAYEIYLDRENAGEAGDPLDDWEKARQILRGDWTR